jgi:hypothetical protein
MKRRIVQVDQGDPFLPKKANPPRDTGGLDPGPSPGTRAAGGLTLRDCHRPDVDQGAHPAKLIDERVLLIEQHDWSEAASIHVAHQIEQRLVGAARGSVIIGLDEQDPASRALARRHPRRTTMRVPP